VEPRRGPDQLPDDATGRDLAAAVGEDVGRQLVGRLSLFVSALCVLAGLTTDADAAVGGTGVGVGAVAFALVALAALARWSLRRQWSLILGGLLASGALLALMLVQHAGRS
jgi:hypothetical protein